MLESAWYGAWLHRVDLKRWPSRPDKLWDANAGDQSVEQMKAIAKWMASNSNVEMP